MTRILHIESNAQDRALVKELLKGLDYQVFEATTGIDGVRSAREEKPDLVLVNVNAPGLDGFEVTLRLRSLNELQGVPIVATGSTGDRSTSLAVGADGVIPKPFEKETFASKIKAHLQSQRRPERRTLQNLRIQSQKIVEHLEDKVRELQSANERLEEMARLRREFLRNITHELATPLTPVVGYLKLLLGQELGDLTPLQTKSLTAIQTATDRLRFLIDTLLDVSHLETGRMHFYHRQYDFAKLAQSALLAMKSRAAEKEVTFEVMLSTDAMEAQGDPDKLARAMVHVMDNAVKFSPRGSQIAVDTKTRDAADGKRHYVLRVADAGTGVEPEQVTKILDAFYQADGSETRHHGGVGLGLAFARRISEALGGGIGIVSPPPEDDPVAGLALPGTLVVIDVAADGHSETTFKLSSTEISP